MRIMTAHSQCNDECTGPYPHREEEDCVVPKERFEKRPDGRHAYEEAQRLQAGDLRDRGHLAASDGLLLTKVE